MMKRVTFTAKDLDEAIRKLETPTHIYLLHGHPLYPAYMRASEKLGRTPSVDEVASEATTDEMRALQRAIHGMP